MPNWRASRVRKVGRSCASTGWGAACALPQAARRSAYWASAGVTSVLAYGAVLAHNGGTARRPMIDPVTGQDGLAHRVLHDPLTDLPNRTLFLDRLELALARLRRSPCSAAVLFIDL